MQFSTALLAAIFASGALALPQRDQRSASTVVVTLDGDSTRPINTFFREVQSGEREQLPPRRSPGPYKTVNLRLGANVQEDLRCQILDEKKRPVIVKRNGSVQKTFADGGNGKWTLEQESLVSAIICDPDFVLAPPKPTETADVPKPTATGAENSKVSVRVKLSGPSELQTQRAFRQGGAVREEQPPLGSTGPYDTVELSVDEEAKDLRCQLLDREDKAIFVARNGAIDNTFADGDAGSWSLLDARLQPTKVIVEAIICDPDFKANNIAA